jgi:DNA-binding transcriptional MerR regulator
MQGGLMRIGALAKKSGVSARSVRYYEELGLIKPITHSQGGFRLYNEDDLRKLDAINDLKELELSLHQIKEIFNARKSGKGDLETLQLVRALLREKLKITNVKIGTLRKIKKELTNTIDMLNVCEFRDNGTPILHEQREICEKCDNLRSRREIPKMLSIFFQKLN